MSQDQDPTDETRRFEPVDPYNIPPDQGAAPTQGYDDYQQGFGQPGFGQPGFEQQPYGALPPEPPQRPGFKQRLTRLGPLKLALLGTAGVIVLGGAAWGTTAAVQSSGSSSNNAAAAPATDQTQSQASGAGATSGGTGKHAKAGKAAKVKITQVGAGSFTGTEGKGGKDVTVDYDAKTKFGSKAHPLTSAQLQVGMTVTVSGERKGDTITATDVVEPAKMPKKPATPGATSSPSDGSTTSDGSATPAA